MPQSLDGESVNDPRVIVALISTKVLAAWVALSDRPPWSRLTTAERVDHLPPLLDAIFLAVFDETSERAHRARMIHGAASHGEDRRSQGYDEEIILDEYYLLRGLLWTELRARLDPARAAPIIVKVDSALSLASAASLRGMNRARLESAGQWPAALDALVARDPLSA
jgi:hypothetical protein